MHKRLPALGEPTFNFTFYENLRHCKNVNKFFLQHSIQKIGASKDSLKSVLLGSKIFLDFRKIFKLSSKEIRFLSKILLKDPRSTLCKNVFYINSSRDVNILVANKVQIRKAIKIEPIPANDQWRVGLLDIFMETRIKKTYSKMNLSKDQFVDTLLSLCTS